MTGENRRRNAADEMERAGVCLREARALRDASLPYGAASRAYYAVFHAARALLFSAGLEATTHKGIVALVGQHFVRPGRLTVAMGRLISRMQRDREDADYATGAVFTDEQSSEMIGDAEAFVAEVQRLLDNAT